MSDVAVIGAGIVGLSTAFALAERGASVTVYERGEPGAAQSGGESRIFRHGHDDPRLVALAVEARAAWREWEERFGVVLVSDDGSLLLGEAVERRLPLLRAAGVRAREIDADELAARLPVIVRREGPAMLDEDGGGIHTRAAIGVLMRALGGGVVADEVLAVRPDGEVRASRGTHRHDRVVVCGGRGTVPLARCVGIELPVSLAAHPRMTYAVRGAPPERLACLQDGGPYGDPLPGNHAYAVGVASTAVRDDGSLVDPAELAHIAETTNAYVAQTLPGLDPEPIDTRHCWVTTLPWSLDGIAVWEADRVLFVAGDNLFKHAPALGRILAAAALGDGLRDEFRPESQLGRV